MIQRNDKLFRAIHTEKDQANEADAGRSSGTSASLQGKENNIENNVNKEESDSTPKRLTNHNVPPLAHQVKELNQQLQNENKALHHLNTSLHEKNHFLSLKQNESQELINAEVTKNEELQNKVDDAEYEVTKCRMKNAKLEVSLSEAQETLKMYVDRDGGKLEQKVVLSNAERKSVEQLTQDLEEQRELASTRMIELEKTNESYKQALKEVEKLKMELSTLPEHVVVETTEHKCLQSQFSVLYNEAMQLKTQLEESRNQLQVAKNTHMRQIEQMESEELLAQKKLRTEVIQLEDMLAQVRKEYEMLRIEFEQNLAANEQTGPINKEMRNLITSLQTHNVQLKGDVARFKRKYKETSVDITKLKKDIDDLKAINEATKLQLKKEKQVTEEGDDGNTETSGLTTTDGQGNNTINASGDAGVENENGTAKIKSEPSVDTPSDLAMEEGCEDSPDSSVAGGTPIKTEKVATVTGTPTPSQGTPVSTPIKKEIGAIKNDNPQELKQKVDELQKQKTRDQDAIKDLKSQLKKALNDVKEMKLLLDMYKTCTKEQRDKAQVMASEKKARADLEEVKIQLKKLTETKRDEKKRLADEDATRRIKQLEDQGAILQKQVANHKQEEEALLNEMEVTGQAFEDMQEQNSRLIQQLREKDDANFKLMSERIKSNQIQRLAREERETLTQQGNTLGTQIEAQNQVVRKLEEKERLLQSNLVAMDKVMIS
jgi:E3 ubiquitin-protein ligase BRE1